MASIKNFSDVNIAQLQIIPGADPQEVVITGIFQGTRVEQTVRMEFPSIIMFDEGNMNFYAYHINGLDQSTDQKFVTIM